MDRPGPRVGEPDQLPALEAPIGLAEQEAQHYLLDRREKRAGQAAGRCSKDAGLQRQGTI